MHRFLASLLVALTLLVAPASAQMTMTGVGPSYPGGVIAGATVDLNFASSQYFGGSSTSLLSISNPLTGGTVRYCTDSVGVLHPFGPNTLAICSGTGLQIYSNTNLQLSSEAILFSNWQLSNVSAGASIAQRDPAKTTTLIIPTVTNSAHFVKSNATITFTSGQTYTFSIDYFPSGVTQLYFESPNTTAFPAATAWGVPFYNSITNTWGGQAAGISVSTETFSNGWKRLHLTSTSVATTTGANSFGAIYFNAYGSSTGDGVSGAYLTNVEVEPASSAGPYIPTTTAAVTSTDNVTATGALLAALDSPTGTVLLAASGSANPVFTQGLLFQNGRELMTGNASSTSVAMWNGTTLLPATFGSGNLSGPTKIASSWSAAGRSIVANNGTVGTDTNTVGAVSGSYSIGYITAARSYNGNIQRLTVFNSRLPDATLKALTQ